MFSKPLKSVCVCAVVLLAAGCGGESEQPEAKQSAKSTKSTKPTKPTQPVVVIVSDDQMAVIQSLPDDVVCFTPAANPIKSLAGLRDDEFASYPTSPAIPQKLMGAFGRADTVVGLRIMGTGDFDFSEEPKLRLFITHEPYAEDLIKGGGVRIQFKTGQQ